MTPAKALLCHGGKDVADGNRGAACPQRAEGRSESRLRRFLGGALSVLSCVAGLMLFGCDSEQNIVVTVQGVPDGTVALGAYYSLDTRPGTEGAAGVTQRVDQFAFKLPADYRGTLTTSVFAYRDRLPCLAGSGSAMLNLSGGYRQEQTIALSPETGRGCVINKVPVTLPPTNIAPIASWGDAPDNIWLVGDKGIILHWDGRVFQRIALPPELAAAPPTWRAVTGAGRDYVWIAGDKGAVARWNGSQLTRVVTVNDMNVPIEPSAPNLPNWLGVAIANPATDDVFFAGHNNLVGHYYKVGFTGVAALQLTDTYRAFPSGSKIPIGSNVAFADVSCISNNECWFVGSDNGTKGFILQAYSFQSDGVYIYTDFSNNMAGNTLANNRLLGIWTTIAVTNRELFIVGAGGTLLYSNNSIVGVPLGNANFYPNFTVLCSGQGCPFPMNLHGIGGATLTDLWVVGDLGTLLHWNGSIMSPANPIIDMTLPTLTAGLQKVFSVGGRVFVSGDQQTFASPIP